MEDLVWVKSSLSFSNSNCVEVAWRKSSASMSDGQCVEVAGLPGNSQDGVLVRNSRDPAGPVLEFTAGEWEAFLGGVRNGEFDGLAR